MLSIPLELIKRPCLDYHALVYTYSNNGMAAKILLDAGADVNSKDWNGVTPLAVAAALGHYNVMELVINHPGVRIDVQVCDLSSS